MADITKIPIRTTLLAEGVLMEAIGAMIFVPLPPEWIAALKETDDSDDAWKEASP